MSLTYFAYGSNMLPARLAARCPSARVIGLAEAPGWRVAFWKLGRDGSGKATLVPEPGALAPGVLFHLSPEDLPALDRAEGAGAGYDRRDDLPVIVEGRAQAAVSYVAPEPRPGLLPFDWYLALVVAGALRAGLSAHHIDDLRRQRWRADPEPMRPGRQEGLRALAAHGWAEPALLLRAQSV